MDLFSFNEGAMRENLLVILIGRTIFVEKPMNLPILWWFLDISWRHQYMLDIGWRILFSIFPISVSLTAHRDSWIDNKFLVKGALFWTFTRQRSIIVFISLDHRSRCDEEIGFAHVHRGLPPLLLKKKFIVILQWHSRTFYAVVYRLLLPFVNSHSAILIWLVTHKRINIKAERRRGMR